MSVIALQQVITRAVADPSFRTRLATGADSALAGYDLSPEERGILLGGDPTALSGLGLDQRVTKLTKSCGGEKG
jgi:hypothetical protein